MLPAHFYVLTNRWFKSGKGMEEPVLQLVCDLVDNLVRQAENYRKIIEVSQKQTEMIRGANFPSDLDSFWDEMAVQKDHLARLEAWREAARELEARLAAELDLPEIRLSLLKDRISAEEYRVLVEAIAELSQAVEEVSQSYERLESAMREQIRSVGRGMRNGAVPPRQVTNAYQSNQTPSLTPTKSDKSTLPEGE